LMLFAFQAALLGSSAAPQTSPLTTVNYSHSTSASLHSICIISSFCFLSLIF